MSYRRYTGSFLDESVIKWFNARRVRGDLSSLRDAATWAGVGSLTLFQIGLQLLIGYGLKAFGADSVECLVGILPMGEVGFACHRTEVL